LGEGFEARRWKLEVGSEIGDMSGMQIVDFKRNTKWLDGKRFVFANIKYLAKKELEIFNLISHI
jgi:hypothetical protein